MTNDGETTMNEYADGSRTDRLVLRTVNGLTLPPSETSLRGLFDDLRTVVQQGLPDL